MDLYGKIQKGENQGKALKPRRELIRVLYGRNAVLLFNQAVVPSSQMIRLPLNFTPVQSDSDS